MCDSEEYSLGNSGYAVYLYEAFLPFKLNNINLINVACFLDSVVFLH